MKRMCASTSIASSILDVIQRYNQTFGDTISVNDKYYMYGDLDLSSEEISIGLLTDLANAYDELAEGNDITDDNIFGDILEDATDNAAGIIITPETAFNDAVNAAKQRYGF